MKECSECGENTKAHARVCPYCLTPFPTMGGSGTESIAPQACDIQALTNKHEKALENAILIGRIIVVVLCFLSVGLYAFVYTIAVLKGNPWGFAAGFREARFDQPSVIVLVSLSALTFIGVLLGLGRFLARSSLKATSAVMAFSIAMLLASASLETIAIYGLVLGFMFGPGVSTLSLLLFMTTIVGGILIFPRVDRCRPAFDKGLQAILGSQPSPPGT
ncbi:MAG: zinc ribbon domain-containing protein [Firmicutes bacterium]|nr:zinc ribbon domain-containing protein [Bacillota bacterium]